MRRGLLCITGPEEEADHEDGPPEDLAYSTQQHSSAAAQQHSSTAK